MEVHCRRVGGDGNGTVYTVDALVIVFKDAQMRMSDISVIAGSLRSGILGALDAFGRASWGH